MTQSQLDQARFLIDHLRRRHFRLEPDGPGFWLAYHGPHSGACLHVETSESLYQQRHAINKVLVGESIQRIQGIIEEFLT